ncbi:MAG: NAD(FAD)-utilizing dehydrogenase [Proteobacteria bacterium SG_bin9]|nr:MAG: NAD(FAD)-utilizing dehydrogenase [Proteobacteria bacterium SG_bin9]
MAAEVLAAGGARVTIYDAMPSAGRKFLMAGRGGLNLTHSEPLDRFMTRYGAAADRLARVIDALTPDVLRTWAHDLGEETFTGSSGRVFPKSFKASPLLRAWLRRLDVAGVTLNLRHRWIGWDGEGNLKFETAGGGITVEADAAVLALGGASWPRLGSDGAWTDLLAAKGVTITPLRPANSGFSVVWSPTFRERFAGEPLKTVQLRFGEHTVRGDAMITKDGIEGGAVYALAAPLRDAITRDGSAQLMIALRPDVADAALTAKLAAPRGKQSFSTFLRKAAGLSPVAIGLLQEAAMAEGGKLTDISRAQLASLINAVPVTLTAAAPLARAISTAGGVAFSEIDDRFMLARLPGVFVAGEMLDWEAPTGGYLLQAACATGAAAGRGVLAWLKAKA